MVIVFEKWLPKWFVIRFARQSELPIVRIAIQVFSAYLAIFYDFEFMLAI